MMPIKFYGQGNVEYYLEDDYSVSEIGVDQEGNEVNEKHPTLGAFMKTHPNGPEKTRIQMLLVSAMVNRIAKTC